MDKSNFYAIAAVLAVSGFVVGKLDAAGRSPSAPGPVSAAPVAAPAGLSDAPPAAAANAPAPSPGPAPSPSPSPAPSAPVAETPKQPSLLDSQSDEGAGKGVDMAKIGVSPPGLASPYIGPKDALVVVNVYSDFQCPVCKRSADPIKQLAADFPGKVKVYFRNNALAMHGRSKPAALAAWAAKNQGKFWQYHDKLFQTGALDDGSLEQAAKDLGLNIDQWKKDIADPANGARLDQEAKWAEEMGATGTPGFFVNGIRQVGWGSYMALKSMVGNEIAKAEEVLGQGAPKGEILKRRVLATAPNNPKNEGEKAIAADAWAKNLTAD
ncbi:MAG: thioredoxin domain-containing protein [Deltaproteobacteria bacterium]|nr:thioredoxin domain-containing protein [Deltaproteobacteria bacterium]